jgi:hypothetical protein
MQYHAPSNQFTISAEDMKRAASLLRWAIRNIREAHNLDPKGYKNDGPMEAPQFAESGILDAARAIGIDLGSDRYGKLDVSNE